MCRVTRSQHLSCNHLELYAHGQLQTWLLSDPVHATGFDALSAWHQLRHRRQLHLTSAAANSWRGTKPDTSTPPACTNPVPLCAPAATNVHSSKRHTVVLAMSLAELQRKRAAVQQQKFQAAPLCSCTEPRKVKNHNIVELLSSQCDC
jgi:hypothetical protein